MRRLRDVDRELQTLQQLQLPQLLDDLHAMTQLSCDLSAAPGVWCWRDYVFVPDTSEGLVEYPLMPFASLLFWQASMLNKCCLALLRSTSVLVLEHTFGHLKPSAKLL